jgi:uncharacterized Fe-S cluster-containing radical SAM superfamily protein
MSRRKTWVDKGKRWRYQQFWNGLYAADFDGCDDDYDGVFNHTKMWEF